MLINLTVQCILMFMHVFLAEYKFVGPDSSWFVPPPQWLTNVTPSLQLKVKYHNGHKEHYLQCHLLVLIICHAWYGFP